MTEEDRAKLKTEDACVNVDRFVVRVGESDRGTCICSCQTCISTNIFAIRCAGYSIVACSVYVWQFPLCFHASRASHTGRQLCIQVTSCIRKRSYQCCTCSYYLNMYESLASDNLVKFCHCERSCDSANPYFDLWPEWGIINNGVQ